MKSFYFLIAMGISLNASAFLAKSNPKEVIDAVIEAQKKSNLECTVEGRTEKYKLSGMDLAGVMAQVPKPEVKVNENSVPQIIINGSQEGYGYEVNIEVSTTPDFNDIQKLKFEHYKWITKRVNVGTITNPRYQENKTKDYFENISCP